MACSNVLIDRTDGQAIPITLMSSKQWSAWLEKQPQQLMNQAQTLNQTQTFFHLSIYDETGLLEKVIAVSDHHADIHTGASCWQALGAGQYAFEYDTQSFSIEQLALGWGLASYDFKLFKSKSKHCGHPQLLLPKALCHKTQVWVDGIHLGRDLINMPPNHQAPLDFAQWTRQFAEELGITFKQIDGQALQDYPLVEQVSIGSDRPGCIVDLSWGNPKHPKVTLIGKGVVFDSGGLDLKPAKAMSLMKKDMGGAACVLSLAYCLIKNQVPIRLRVMIPMVENMPSSKSYRTSDVIASRSGRTVEIGNTDAEGRLILADVITDACDDSPDLLIDMATLTGAARVALGTDLPAFFSNQKDINDQLRQVSHDLNDPMWPMPLHPPYRSLLKSKVADLSSTGSTGFGGAITAALFLQAFVGKNIPWVHIDLMAWNQSAKPGQPIGGEVMGVRALYAFIDSRFSEA